MFELNKIYIEDCLSCIELFSEYKRVIKPDACILFFCDWRGYAFSYPIFDVIIGATNLLDWDKISAPGNKYSFSHELLIFHAPSSLNKCGSPILRVPRFGSGAKKIERNKVHPTQKPLVLIRQLIESHSQIGETVLDTITGSSTTTL